jgi:hypothetical protein
VYSYLTWFIISRILEATFSKCTIRTLKNMFSPFNSNSVLNRIRNNFIWEEIKNVSLFYVIIVGSLLVEDWVASKSKH